MLFLLSEKIILNTVLILVNFVSVSQYYISKSEDLVRLLGAHCAPRRERRQVLHVAAACALPPVLPDSLTFPHELMLDFTGSLKHWRAFEEQIVNISGFLG